MTPIAIALLASAALRQSAGLPSLGPASAVDIRVKSVDWHPGGNELIYTREMTGGIGVGMYRVGAPQGKVLLQLSEKDRIRADWFPGVNRALLSVTTKLPDGMKGTVYLLDGDRELATAVFSRTVHGKETIKITPYLSPSLSHAILRVVEGDREYHSVLTLNTTEVVGAPDLDQAEKDGYAGPAWSASGTAVYAKDTGEEKGIWVETLLNRADFRDQTDARVLAEVEAATYRDLANRFSIRFTAIKAPAAGTPVLELMPTNGVLRQVRSPGPWEEAPSPEPKIAETSHAVAISFGLSTGPANSLWLTKPAPETAGSRQRQEPQTGSMVAAHADSAQLAPGEKAIAYIIDGALFVRRISSAR